MARGGRMGQGQPDMERNKTRLQAEGDKGEHEKDVRRCAADTANPVPGAEIEGTARRPKGENKSQEESRSYVRGDEIDPAGADRFRVLLIRDDEKE